MKTKKQIAKLWNAHIGLQCDYVITRSEHDLAIRDLRQSENTRALAEDTVARLDGDIETLANKIATLLDFREEVVNSILPEIDARLGDINGINNLTASQANSLTSKYARDTDFMRSYDELSDRIKSVQDQVTSMVTARAGIDTQISLVESRLQDIIASYKSAQSIADSMVAVGAGIDTQIKRMGRDIDIDLKEHRNAIDKSHDGVSLRINDLESSFNEHKSRCMEFREDTVRSFADASEDFAKLAEKCGIERSVGGTNTRTHPKFALSHSQFNSVCHPGDAVDIYGLPEGIVAATVKSPARYDPNGHDMVDLFVDKPGFSEGICAMQIHRVGIINPRKPENDPEKSSHKTKPVYAENAKEFNAMCAVGDTVISELDYYATAIVIQHAMYRFNGDSVVILRLEGHDKDTEADVIHVQIISPRQSV